MLRMRAELAGLTIVIVDDHEDSLEWMRLALEHAGAEVLSAPSAQGGWELLGRHEPHVLISDLSMPEHAGYWLVRMMRSSGRLKRVPAIAVSGQPAARVSSAATAAGFDAFLQKPVDPDLLRSTTFQLARQSGVL